MLKILWNVSRDDVCRWQMGIGNFDTACPLIFACCLWSHLVERYLFLTLVESEEQGLSEERRREHGTNLARLKTASKNCWPSTSQADGSNSYRQKEPAHPKFHWIKHAGTTHVLGLISTLYVLSVCSHLCHHLALCLQVWEICYKWLHINVIAVTQTLKSLRMISKEREEKNQRLVRLQIVILLLKSLSLSLNLCIWNVNVLRQCWGNIVDVSLAGPMTTHWPSNDDKWLHFKQKAAIILNKK